MWNLSLTEVFNHQFSRLSEEDQCYIMEWIEHMHDLAGELEFELDIIDEYDGSVEKMKMPVNYYKDTESETLYILSLSIDGTS